MMVVVLLLFTNFDVVQTQGRQTTINDTNAISLEDYRNLNDYLLANYTRHIRPLLDQTMQMEVNCVLQFKSVLGYDVVNGVFSFSGDLETDWKDETLIWNAADFGGLSRIRIAANRLWMPNIGIENSAEDGNFLNTESTGMYLLVKSDGFVGVKYSGTMRTTCTPEAYYYPFDIHTCSVDLVAFGYGREEIHLKSLEVKDDKNSFLRHAEWEVELGDTEHDNGILPTISVNVHLKRRSTNVFLTTLLPLFMLVLLQVLVFILPPESGERISYSITMFLSYAVFMTIVAENVPTSNPVALISTFLTFLLVNGAIILIVNIMILNIYHRDKSKKVPKLCQVFTACILNGCRRTKNNVAPQDHQNEFSRKESLFEVNDDENTNKWLPSNMNNPFSDEIPWSMVAHALDMMCFVIFISIIFIFFVSFYFVHYY